MYHMIWVAVWLCIAVYAFYILGRADTGRERTGRRLVGIGALLVAASLVTPLQGPELAVGDVLALAAMMIAGVMLAVGLFMAIPPAWRRRSRPDDSR
jgi:Na+/H+ antiporter NhaD/arsenite permease-like protein